MKNTIKIMKAKSEVTDEEIQSFMDFETLLQKNLKLRESKARVLRNGITGLVTVVVFSGMWWFFNQPKVNKVAKDQAEVIKNDQAVLQKFDEKVSGSSIDSPKIVKKEIAGEKKQEQNELPKSKEIIDLNKEVKKNTADPVEKPVVQPVYIQAEPAEGYPALYKYFSASLTYPVEMMKDSIEGVVTVSFSVNTKGRPEKISIDKSLGEAFDREAKRVIENMPLWKPAMYDHKPVTTRMSLPLTFQIRKIEP